VVIIIELIVEAAIYTVSCSCKIDLCTLRCRAKRCQRTCSESSTIEVLSAFCISRHSGYQRGSWYAWLWALGT